MIIVKFDAVVDQVKHLSDFFGESLEPNLYQYVPSIVGQYGESVIVKVKKGNPLWTKKLEQVVSEHVMSFIDATGKKCTLTVVYV